MFSRGSRTSGRHARTERSRPEQSRPRRSLAEELGSGPGGGPGGTGGPGSELSSGGSAGDHLPAAAGQGPAAAPEPAVAAGPYDISEAPAGAGHLDLGSLRIPSVPGVEVRVQANQDGAVQQVFLVDGESLLQLGAFAAPRTEPIWDEVRTEIRKALFDDGVAAEDVPGPYGTELRARVRTKEGLKDLRFVGVDGPRWLVRAVYQGPAAVDPARAGRLTEVLRGLVVNRGNEARPIKEPLPLRLSEQLAARVSHAAGTVPTGTAPAGGPATGIAPAGGPATGAAPGGGPRRKPSPRPRRQAAG